MVTSVQSNTCIAQVQYINSYAKTRRAALARNHQLENLILREKWAISMDHWTTASHHLKSPAKMRKQIVCLKGQGVKLDAYWIHRQPNQPFSSLTHLAAHPSLRGLPQLFGSSYLSTTATPRAPSHRADPPSTLTPVHGSLSWGLPRGGQCPPKGDPLSRIQLWRRAAVTQPFAFFR